MRSWPMKLNHGTLRLVITSRPASPSLASESAPNGVTPLAQSSLPTTTMSQTGVLVPVVDRGAQSTA